MDLVVERAGYTYFAGAGVGWRKDNSFFSYDVRLAFLTDCDVISGTPADYCPFSISDPFVKLPDLVSSFFSNPKDGTIGSDGYLIKAFSVKSRS